jgi:Rieske Fe-S protein
VKDNELVVDKSQWGENEFVLVKNQQLSAPVFVKRLPTGYTALYLECTHKKCEVRPNSKSLKCPCHGSEFDHLGQVITGPAEIALKSFQIREDENNIYIQ